MATVILFVLIVCSTGLFWVFLDNWWHERYGHKLHQHKYRMHNVMGNAHYFCIKHGCTKNTSKVRWPFGRHEFRK